MHGQARLAGEEEEAGGRRRGHDGGRGNDGKVRLTSVIFLILLWVFYPLRNYRTLYLVKDYVLFPLKKRKVMAKH